MMRYPIIALILSMIFIIVSICMVRAEPLTSDIINLWIGFFAGGLYGWYLK